MPVNQKAIERLDYDFCIDGDLIEIILNKEEYRQLWDSGILDAFNETLGVLIDDFEEEVIKGADNLSLAKTLTRDYMDKHPHTSVLRNLFIQIDLAEKYQTGLFFYF